MPNDPNIPHDPPHDPVEHLDTLVSRAVDGRASRTEWDAIEQAASADGALWRRVALSYRDQSHMELGLSQAVMHADAVDLPTRLEAERHARAWGERFGSVRSWGGWAAAAILTFGVVIQTNRLGQANSNLMGGLTQPGTGPQSAGLFSSASDAFNAYLDKGKKEGRVLGEVPDALLVDSQPAQDGVGYDVIFVRQVLERAHVPDLYRYSHDEAGTPRPLRVRVVSPAHTGGGTPNPAQSTY